MNAVVLEMAALLLQMVMVPQRLIPFAAEMSAGSNLISPPSPQVDPGAATATGTSANQPHASLGDSQLQRIPDVTQVPGRLALDAAGVSRMDSVLPLPSRPDLALAAFRPSSAEAEPEPPARMRREWFMLSLAQHSAAAFDAWSTRQVISSGRVRELNPMLRPFAGNASVYVAVQAGPFLLDYVSRRMMTNRHGWVRHLWWMPQAVSTAMSLVSGFHNLNLASAAVP